MTLVLMFAYTFMAGGLNGVLVIGLKEQLDSYNRWEFFGALALFFLCAAFWPVYLLAAHLMAKEPA